MAQFFHLVVHSRHWLGLLGLVLNTTGAFLLIPFPPDLRGLRSDGTLPGPRGFGWSIFVPDGSRRYVFQKVGFIATIFLLAIGFILQFFDLIYVM
jgi:hypothetical protein